MFKVRLKNKAKKYERVYQNVKAKDAMEAHAWGEKQAAQSGPVSEFVVEVLGTMEETDKHETEAKSE